MIGVLFAFLFIVSSVIEASFIHTLPFPFFLFPLTFIIGILIIHRGQLALGVTWFIILGPTISWIGFDEAKIWPYIVVATLAIPLSKRVFVQRSVYAMEGLGILLFLSFAVVNIPFSYAGSIWEASAAHLTQLILLIIVLYIAFLLLMPLERFAKNFLGSR